MYVGRTYKHKIHKTQTTCTQGTPSVSPVRSAHSSRAPSLTDSSKSEVYISMYTCNKYSIVQLCNCTTVQLYNCEIVQLCNYTTVQLYNCAIVQLCNCTTVQLYNCEIVQLCTYASITTISWMYCNTLWNGWSRLPWIKCIKLKFRKNKK